MNILLIQTLFSFFTALGITLYLVPRVRAIAYKLQFLDAPDGTIKTHAQTTPYLGGLAVYLGFLGALALTYPFENQVLLFFIGATLLLFLGLLDDLVPMSAMQKFLGQIVAAFCFLKAGLHLKAHFFDNYWNIGISFMWMLTIMNAFNLVDVMDGLASTLAMGSATIFLILALLMGQADVALLLACFIGAVAGFFWYNKPTATIYLGDAGSLFIGGFLAIIPFLFSWGSHSAYGYILPIVVLAIPLLEVTFLIIIRTYKGIPFYKASPDHFCIYFMKSGWSKYQILGYMVFLLSILGSTIVLFVTHTISECTLLSLGAAFLTLWLGMLMRAKYRI